MAHIPAGPEALHTPRPHDCAHGRAPTGPPGRSARGRAAKSLALLLAATIVLQQGGEALAIGFVTTWGSEGAGDGEFFSPYGVAVGPDGSVYVADDSNHRIQKFDSAGAFVTTWGSFGHGDGEFFNPLGVAVASDGSVYVSDWGDHRIQKFYDDPPIVTLETASNDTTAASGWYNAVSSGVNGVRVNVSAADPSGVTALSCTDNGTSVLALSGGSGSFVLRDGVHSIACTATNTLGQSGAAAGSTTMPVQYKVDQAGPRVTRDAAADSCTVPGSNGWCRGTQTAGFSASDATSGTVSPCTAAATASCAFTKSSSTNGAAVSIGSGAVSDAAGNPAAAVNASPFKVDTTGPTLTCQSPAPTFTPGQTGAKVTAKVADALSTPLAKSASAAASTTALGDQTASVTGADKAGNTATVACGYRVRYPSATLKSHKAPPKLNAATAGTEVRVVFSLGGDQGLDVFEAGSPASASQGCGAAASAAEAGPRTVLAEGFVLSYSANKKQYTLAWQTDAPWQGTCRRLTLRLKGGTVLVADFRFT